MSKHIITTDNQDQGWLDSFNKSIGADFKMNQEIKEEEMDAVGIIVDDFNYYVAKDNVILIKELVDDE